LNYFSYHSSIGQHHSIKEEKKKEILIRNDPSFCFTYLKCECILYIWSCMRTFPLWIEEKGWRKGNITNEMTKRCIYIQENGWHSVSRRAKR
jgi:hypothetical protein